MGPGESKSRANLFFFWGGVGGAPPPTPPQKNPGQHQVVKRFFMKKSPLTFEVQATSISINMIEELKAMTLKRIEEVYQRLEDNYRTQFLRPKVLFNLRGHRAGVADTYKNLIRLNQTILLDYREEFIADTPGHEVAHLVARRLHGLWIRSHGPEWQSVMNVVGQPAKRCHVFVVKTKNVYCCGCVEKHYVSTRLHNSFLRGDVKLTCLKCKQPLVWEKI